MRALVLAGVALLVTPVLGLVPTMPAVHPILWVALVGLWAVELNWRRMTR